VSSFLDMYDPDFIAGSAELAMLLEVSATPKPGNVDRTHDFEDVTYEHFLSVHTIQKQRLTLFDIMDLSSSNDTIAREWTEGFPLIFRGQELLKRFQESAYNLNDSIVCLFLTLLSETPDTLVAKKFGSKVALEVSKKAAHALIHGNIDDFDKELIAKRINPGTTADLVIGSLFVTLLGGFRY